MKDRSDRRGSPRPNRPHTGATRIRNVLLALALISAVVMLASGAWAAETITIPVGTDRGDPGELIPKGTIPAEAGDQCIGTLTYTNNGPDFSEHPGTDIVAGPVEWRDVERGPGRTFDPQPFTATGPVPVALRIGGDGVSSGGFTVGVTCTTTTPTTEPERTTTTPTPAPSTTTTTVTVPTSAPSVTTTTEPAPVGPVPAGGGGCADAACDPVGVAAGQGAPGDGWSLSPWETWAGIIGALLIAILVAAAVDVYRKGRRHK